MTVRELISELQKLDQDRRIVIDGYERGQCDIFTIEEIKLLLHVNPEDSYCGPHETAPGDLPFDEIAYNIPR